MENHQALSNKLLPTIAVYLCQIFHRKAQFCPMKIMINWLTGHQSALCKDVLIRTPLEGNCKLCSCSSAEGSELMLWAPMCLFKGPILSPRPQCPILRQFWSCNPSSYIVNWDCCLSGSVMFNSICWRFDRWWATLFSCIFYTQWHQAFRATCSTMLRNWECFWICCALVGHQRLTPRGLSLYWRLVR